MRNESWTTIIHGKIPKEEYAMRLIQGDENGLVIHLFGSKHKITLDFGNVQAINILDEGVQLCAPPGVAFKNQPELHHVGFPDTLYLVENGAYAAYIQACMGQELYEFLNLRQYNLVTTNYVTEIICSAEPIITICDN